VRTSTVWSIERERNMSKCKLLLKLVKSTAAKAICLRSSPSVATEDVLRFGRQFRSSQAQMNYGHVGTSLTTTGRVQTGRRCTCLTRADWLTCEAVLMRELLPGLEWVTFVHNEPLDENDCNVDERELHVGSRVRTRINHRRLSSMKFKAWYVSMWWDRPPL
jgi:hypothetical protein